MEYAYKDSCIIYALGFTLSKQNSKKYLCWLYFGCFLNCKNYGTKERQLITGEVFLIVL
jgi:hypothetical protein